MSLPNNFNYQIYLSVTGISMVRIYFISNLLVLFTVRKNSIYYTKVGD